jgi:hypothetical protein
MATIGLPKSGELTDPIRSIDRVSGCQSKRGFERVNESSCVIRILAFGKFNGLRRSVSGFRVLRWGTEEMMVINACTVWPCLF